MKNLDEENPVPTRESNIIINRQYVTTTTQSDNHNNSTNDEELIIEEEIHQQQQEEEYNQSRTIHDEEEIQAPSSQNIQPESSTIQRFRRTFFLGYLLKLWDIASSMIPLGLLSFGGPVAHISILQENFVTKRQWITLEQFTELFAVCQSLPGPTSTQLVIALGSIHAGYLGGFLSFIFFALPTAIIMGCAGVLLKDQNVTEMFPYYLKVAMNGFSCAAVSIVLHAAYTLSSRLTTDKISKTLLLAAFAVFIIWQKWYTVLIVMFCGGLINLVFEYTQIFYQRTIKEHGLRKPKGFFASAKFFARVFLMNLKEFKQYVTEKFSILRRRNNNRPSSDSSFALEETGAESEPQLLGNEEDAADLESNSPKEEDEEQELPLETTTNNVEQAKLPLVMRPFMGVFFLTIFFILLFGLFIARISVKYAPLEWAEGFYRIGSLIFGGGHVVLPMILNEFSELGYLTEDSFLNGFALQSALPGPMFNISAYVGGVMGGVLGAFICWISLFLPAFLFVWGALPFWHKYREKQVVKSILKGINATSVGFVFTAVYILWLGSVPNLHIASACTVVFSVLMLSVYDIPAPLVIIAAGAIRILLDFKSIQQ